MAKILITGGAGYIGSHTALELLNKGYEVVVYDNLSNSSQESLRRVEELTGKKVAFYEGDILDKEALTAMFKAENVDAVIHCAALKAVGESVQKPLEYYHNNITGTLSLMGVIYHILKCNRELTAQRFRIVGIVQRSNQSAGGAVQYLLAGLLGIGSGLADVAVATAVVLYIRPVIIRTVRILQRC